MSSFSYSLSSLSILALDEVTSKGTTLTCTDYDPQAQKPKKEFIVRITHSLIYKQTLITYHAPCWNLVGIHLLIQQIFVVLCTG